MAADPVALARAAARQLPEPCNDIPAVRKYRAHLSPSEALEDLIDAPVLIRNAPADAVPYWFLVARFDFPIPAAAVEEIERIEGFNDLSLHGRPPPSSGDA